MKHLWIVTLLFLLACDTADQQENDTPSLIISNHPPEHVQTDHQFIQIRVSQPFACGLSNAGEVWCWGYNDNFQLGTPDVEEFTEQAVRVNIDEKVIAIDTGKNHGCALTEHRDVYCWGSGSYELGLAQTTINRSLPTRLETDLRFTSIAAGEGVSCGIAESGKIYCWGKDISGALLGGGHSSSPVPIYEGIATRLEMGTSSDMCHGIALTEEQNMISWGCNHAPGTGLAIAATFSADKLPAPFVDIAQGCNHTCGLTETGKVYCVGHNNAGQAGPTLDFSHERISFEYNYSWQEITLAAPFSQVSAGSNHTCGVDIDGALHCWGENTFSQLGTAEYETCQSPNSTCSSDNFLGTNCYSPQYACLKNPHKVELGEVFSHVATGYDRTYALTSEGKLFRWGKQ